jgi:hypothetical protein
VGRGLRIPEWCRVYAAAIALLLIVTISVFATGQWVRIEANEHLMTLAYDVDQLRFPDWEGPMRRLQREQRPGDIVISHMPHAAEYTMHQLNGGDSNPRDRWRVDYWLQTAMILQSSLGDEQLIPRDRRSGAEMIVNLDQLKQIFATHDRIWYVTARNGQNRINDKEVSEFLRNNMDVVHEDFVTTLLLRDKNHRPASVQVEDDEKGKEAREFYLR